MPKKSNNAQNWLSLINIDSVYSSDKQRQALSLFAMIAIAIVVLSMLVILNYDVYSPILTISLILVNITITSSTLYFIKTGKLEVVALISMGIVFIMCIALTYTGGKENTGLYWLMFYPVVSFASLGAKHGTWLGSCLLVCCTFILYGPDIGQVNYPEVEKSRFLAAFTLVFVFSFIGEYFRHKSHMDIAGITLEQTQDAYTDQLTGGANRRFITSHFLKLVDENPHEYLPFSILLLDLDNFKAMNDTYGHDFGDTVLIEFTKLLESQFPSSAVKARYGGEEFVVILPNERSQRAAKLADKFRNHVSEHVILTSDKAKVAFTCSIGVAQVNNVAEYDNELKKADEYLYLAKEQGRNKVMSAHS
ncbi:GGDEF domain-containing protein [Pseudoalteromonas carrageenovora]|uniref:GGDEF domain-containing protein n=1 Tax=Pseudoalteromonas carrageenovora TaxID=227 RepID=UPI0026E200BF|nr:GGDEF domain-containing protein [Pseudoalteromonas carrageenovora]MDO6546299.1 GGDEF domain-containing protein [Pseudoalteromonas carrageenovora]MDO6830838.1 GGDEF domain-containing protein [Pseudoalteromonas carrageenovora]